MIIMIIIIIIIIIITIIITRGRCAVNAVLYCVYILCDQPPIKYPKLNCQIVSDVYEK